MCVSDTPETLKQVKVIKPGSKLSHAKFGIPRLHSGQETVWVGWLFFFWGGVNSVMHQLSPLNIRESKNQVQWYIHDLVNVINYHAKFQLNRIRT